MNTKLLIVSVLMSLTLMACQQKGEKWFSENQSAIAETANINVFFVPDSATIVHRLSILEKNKNNLEKVNITQLSTESQAAWRQLKVKLETAILYFEQFTTHPNQYEICSFVKKEITQTSTNFDKINDILILSDTFYTTAKSNLKEIKIAEAQATINQHIQDYHWLTDTLPTIISKNDINEQLANDLKANIYTTQLQIKDYIGFVNSLVYDAKTSNQ